MNLYTFLLGSTLAAGATALTANAAPLVNDPDKCKALIPVLDRSVRADVAQSLYDLYSRNHGWTILEHKYELKPTALRRYTIGLTVDEDGQPPQVKEPLVCELPTHWEARPYSWVNLRTPSTLNIWPVAADDTDSAAWSFFGGIGRNGAVSSLHHRFAWFGEAGTYRPEEIGDDLHSKYGFLGSIEVSPDGASVAGDGAIGFKVTANAVTTPNQSYWLVRNGDPSNGTLFPPWSDDLNQAATNLIGTPARVLNPMALDEFLPAHHALDLAGLDVVALQNGQARYTTEYCAPSQCFSNVGINKLLDDTLDAAKANGGFSVEVVFRFGANNYGRGVYTFDPQTGLTSKEYKSARSLSELGLDWLSGYRRTQNLAP